MTVEETIRAAIAAYRARDVEAALGFCAPDICFTSNGAAGLGAWEFDCRGIGAFRDALAQIDAEFEIEDYDLVELIVDGNRAASRQRLRLVERATGTRFETQIADFWTVEEGRIRSILEFHDTADMARHRALGRAAGP